MSTTSPAASEPVTHRLARFAFTTARKRDAGGTPSVSPEFVAEQGQHVRILDVRTADELSGLLGHIPAVTHVPMERLGAVRSTLDPDTLVIVVSNTGTRAAIGARYLESLGMSHVAAMAGGMAAWKKLGFSTPRAPSTVRWELKCLPPGMGRDGRPLAPARKGDQLGAQQILEHVGDPGAVRWVKLAAFLLHGKRSCVDGRDDHGVIGTPGGDLGELLLALSCVEDLRGEPLGDAEVCEVLVAHVDTFGRFYLHSDMHAMNRVIVEGFRTDPRIAPHITHVFEPLEWRQWLASPPEALRPALVDHLVKAENLGCGHLKFACSSPEYGVRPGLAAALLRAFFELRWAGAPETEFVILGGDHVEGAVVQVLVDGPLRSYTRIPLVSPQVDGLQMFVAHPEVTAHLRAEGAAFLVERGLVPADAEGALAAAITAKGDRQLAATLGRLAKGLPVYRITFDGGAPKVAALGVV
jgi:rhodanese-related sulfurtransferase